MSWRSRESGASAWRQCLGPLRQEAAASGIVAPQSIQAALESLRAATIEVQDNELAEDLSFLVQQLVGHEPSLGASTPGDSTRDSVAPRVALCRLLVSLTSGRSLSLHGPAANFLLSVLRQWSDGGPDDACTPTRQNSTISTISTISTFSAAPNTSPAASCAGGLAFAAVAAGGGCGSGAADGAAAPPTVSEIPAAAAASLPVEAMTALAALLPDHLGLLSEHERAAQFAALLSLLVPQQPTPTLQQQQQDRATDLLELQVLALTVLAACCGRPSAGGGNSGGSLTADEAAALLSSAVSLLQSVVSRSRPVEDAAHSRLYGALVRALQAAIGEARQAWVARAAVLVEGLQRFLMYGVHASQAATVAEAQPPLVPGTAATAAADAASGGGGGGRYRPPHLRHRVLQTSVWSDSDISDTEHAGGISGSAAAAAGPGAGGTGSSGRGGVVDRFRSSRVRLGALSCIQAMAKSDPRAMHVHWSALLPLQNPLQPRPLTPHLITALLYDPLAKVRLLAAATLASLLDGPAQRAILAVAEARSMAARAPVRGFLTLSLSLGQLLLGAHAGLLHAVAGGEASSLVLPGVLRALVALMAASPYERLPPELLPETLKALRTRWAALTAASAAPHGPPAAAGELAPIQAAYLACLAECFSTKHPIPGLAAFLQQNNQQQQNHQQQLQQPQSHSAARISGGCGAGESSGVGGGVGGLTEQLVHELLSVGRDASVAAVLRIEALAALKGLAAHYTAALPPGVWEDLRATAAVGLSCSPLPRDSPGSRARDGLPLRSSFSSSISAVPTHGSPTRPNADRTGGELRGSASRAAPWGSRVANAAAADAAFGQGGAGSGPVSSSANSSPEDKAAQLSVKLLSDYMAAVARQYGISRTDSGGAGSADGEGGLPGPPPSPGFVPLLSAAVPRLQQQSAAAAAALSSVSVRSEEERAAGVQRLAIVWQDAVGVLVPAATSHTSYMVRSAGLACLGEVPEPVFSSLPPHLQQQLLTLLSDAAAGDPVPAVRAAACKALGAAAAFPAVLAHPQLSDYVTRALLPCLRDAVLSARIAAGWAVANLCDAYRRRQEAAAATHGDNNSDGDSADPEQRLGALRAESHAHASTSASSSPPAMAQTAPPPAPPLAAHHYRQLAALCGAAITATHDTDKVRSNGVRALGNLLAVLTPDMASGLAAEAAAAAAAATVPAAEPSGSGAGATGSWRSATRHDASPNARRGLQGSSASAGGREKYDSSISSSGAGAGNANRRVSRTDSDGGVAGGGIHLDAWLDHALTCLQSALTTGGMKVQWNACCAAHGLLRNQRLLAHACVTPRVVPLLLLLVMLVRESANFKIRTHAAAALAALPRREAYGDVLPDALLVVTCALESVSGGAAAPPPPSKAAGAGEQGRGSECGGEGGDGDGDGGEGRFPNYRYTGGLSMQLRSTLLHLLSLARSSDARRVREPLARRAEFLHACLREQLAEAVQQLRAEAAAMAALRGGGTEGAASGRGDGGWAVLRGRADGSAAAEFQLPTDPFGLSAGRVSSAGAAAGAAGGLAGLLAGLSLAAESPIRSAGTEAALAEPGKEGGTAADAAGVGTSGGTGKSSLTVRVNGGGAGVEGEELLRPLGRVEALAAPLRGFAELLPQLGPSCEPMLKDVRQALAQLPLQSSPPPKVA